MATRAMTSNAGKPKIARAKIGERRSSWIQRAVISVPTMNPRKGTM
jgi:hypothetical protein